MAAATITVDPHTLELSPLTATVWLSGRSRVQVLVGLGYLGATCCITALLASRRQCPFTHQMPWISRVVLLLLVTSLIYINVSSTLLFTIGTSSSLAICDGASVLAVSGYICTKGWILAFLLERVYLVHDFGAIRRRRSSRTYRLAIIPILATIALLFNAILGRQAELRYDEDTGLSECYIGLRESASIPIIIVEVVITATLLLAFLIPLLRAQFVRSKALARKSILASIVALGSPLINLTILIVSGGREKSFVWLGTCALDVTVNAIIIFATTSKASTSSYDSQEFSLPPPMTVDLRTKSGFSTPRPVFSPTQSFQVELPPRSFAGNHHHFVQSHPELMFLEPIRGTFSAQRHNEPRLSEDSAEMV